MSLLVQAIANGKFNGRQPDPIAPVQHTTFDKNDEDLIESSEYFNRPGTEENTVSSSAYSSAGSSLNREANILSVSPVEQRPDDCPKLLQTSHEVGNDGNRNTEGEVDHTPSEIAPGFDEYLETVDLDDENARSDNAAAVISNSSRLCFAEETLDREPKDDLHMLSMPSTDSEIDSQTAHADEVNSYAYSRRGDLDRQADVGKNEIDEVYTNLNFDELGFIAGSGKDSVDDAGANKKVDWKPTLKTTEEESNMETESNPAQPTVVVKGEPERRKPGEGSSPSLGRRVTQARTHFPWLNDCLPQEYAFGKQKVSAKQFVKFFGKSDIFSTEIFIIFDSDESGSVSKREVLGALGKLKCRPAHERALEKLDVLLSKGGDEYNEYDIVQFKTFFMRHADASKCLFELFDYDGNGSLTTTEMHRSLEKISCMDNNAKLLAWMDEQFTKIAGEERSITKTQFKSALDAKNTFFVDRIFNMLDSDGSGSLELVELIDGISSLISGDRTDKMKFLFQMYDADNSGSIDRDELKVYLKSCLDESRLQIPPYQFERLVSVVFDDADEDRSGTITFDELQAQLEKHPMLLDDLSLSAGNWLRPAKKKTKKKWRKPRIFTKAFVRNNASSIVFWILYTLLSIGLFVEAASRYWPTSNAYVVIARGCGQLLNFNSVFVLTLMLRNTITFLRNTKLSRVINFDSYISAHKVVGFVIFGCSIVHTVMHLANIDVLTYTTGLTYVQILFTTAAGVGWVAGSAFITGDILIIILTIMVVCAMPCIRNRGHFGVFFLTHQLYIAYIILLILHGPSFWKWVVVPGLVLIIEVILRMKWVNRLRLGKVFLDDAKTLPSNVTHLIINRPKKFKFKAGDYVFLNIPKVAEFEWHPFTISSPPEDKENIWLHVRAVGNWTKRLYNLIENVTNFKKTSRAIASARTGMRRFVGSQRMRMRTENEVQNRGEDTETEKKRQRKESIQRAVSAKKMEAWSRHHTEDYVLQENILTVFKKGNKNHVAPAPIVIDVKKVKDPEDPTPLKQQNGQAVEVKGASNIQVYLDGPYGAPATDIFNTDHAVLVAAGIGVTPFACILQSIMNRYTAAMAQCPNCNHEWMNELPKSIMQLRKVDFMWINRDQKAFDWFLSILAQLEAQQKKLSKGNFGKFLDIHLYLTSLLKKNDVKAIGLQMALDLMYEVQNEDVITGLQTQMQPGRPDWDKLFQGFQNEGKGDVTVFYCGPPVLGDLLAEKCAHYGFDFKREIF